MVAAAFLVLGLAGGASAATSVGGAAAPAGVHPAVASASSNAAGYYVTPTYGFASASATFVVPKVTCSTSSTYQYFGLFDDNPANGPGSYTLASIEAVCSSGSLTDTYFAWINGTEQNPTGIKAGDTIVVSLFQTASNEVAIVNDITTNISYSALNNPLPDTGMMVGVDSSIPTAQFSKVSFTQVQVNGQYLNALSSTSTQYNLLDGAKTLIKTSAVASPGDTFTLTFKHAS